MNESELYKSIKQELMHQRENVRYFNRAFFGVYLEWYRMWIMMKKSIKKVSNRDTQLP